MADGRHRTLNERAEGLVYRSVAPATAKAYENYQVRYVMWMADEYNIPFERIYIETTTETVINWITSLVLDDGLKENTVKHAVSGVKNLLQMRNVQLDNRMINRALRGIRQRQQQSEPLTSRRPFPLTTLLDAVRTRLQPPIRLWTIPQLGSQALICLRIATGMRTDDVSKIWRTKCDFDATDAKGKKGIRLWIQHDKGSRIRADASGGRPVFLHFGEHSVEHIDAARLIVAYVKATKAAIDEKRWVSKGHTPPSLFLARHKTSSSRRHMMTNATVDTLRRWQQEIWKEADIDDKEWPVAKLRSGVATFLSQHMTVTQLTKHMGWKSIQTGLKHYIESDGNTNLVDLMMRNDESESE